MSEHWRRQPRDRRGQWAEEGWAGRLSSRIGNEVGGRSLTPGSQPPADNWARRLSDRIGTQVRRQPTPDEQDLVDEIESVGAQVNPDGTATVYHFTTPQAAERIRRTGRLVGAEDGVFFTTKPTMDAQAGGRGSGRLTLRVPLGEMVLDDLFDDEAHLRIPTSRSGAAVDVSEWLA